ncbi:glycoside hydrolase family 104 protein [Aquabacterium sp.]|uniref:glycoside hydrolase family 24 protein n=1 Tax=Aquabacterium sp. TaxID=1872578 RepID=UPI0025B93E1C|nr:glycoside hydrolase family 104 protein [Aquabacterium sp.]
MVVLGYLAMSDEDTQTEAAGVASDLLEGAAQAVDKVTSFKISRMASVDKALVDHPQVRAMLAVIRRGEGTADAAGYSRLFGGASFSGFADHPRQAVSKWGLTSTAAGAYQMLSKVWDETRDLMGLGSFSPRNQDIAALGRIAARGALPDVLAGNLTAAIKRLNKEWASLPESPYGQGTITWATARDVFSRAGGSATA